VYHEQWLREILLSSKKHPFGNIFLLDNTELLNELKKLVTTEPTTNMQRPTGIPTHIDLQLKIEQILENNVDFLEQLKLQSTVIQQSVKQAIQENDLLSGNVTMPILTEKLDSHHLFDFIKTNINHLATDNPGNNNILNNNPRENELSYVAELHSKEGTPTYVYDGQFWDVPKEFQQNPTRKVGWEFWLRGKPGNEMLVNGVLKKAPIKPFRKLSYDCLPDSEKNTFSSNWKPIYDYMEKTPDLVIPPDPQDIDDDFIEESYNKATEFLKQRLSFIWEKRSRTLATWKISTWSKYVSHGYVVKYGNEQDKQQLEPNYRNIPRRHNRNDAGISMGNNNNNNNQNQNNNNTVSRTKRSNQHVRGRGKRTNNTNTGGTQNIAELFARSFNPNPVYMEIAKATTNENGEVIDIDADEEMNEETDQSNSNLNSTDPSLIVQLPSNVENGTIPNASRTTAATFTAAVTTILEAAEIDTDEN
jgi:hypothetical protein